MSSAKDAAARRGRRQSSRSHNSQDSAALDLQGLTAPPGNPAIVGTYSPYQADPYSSVRHGEYCAEPDTMHGIDYAQSRPGHASSAHRTHSSNPTLAQRGHGNVTQGSAPSHYNASIGPVHLSVPSHQPSRSHTPAPSRHSSTPVPHYSGQAYPPSAPPMPPFAHEHSRHRGVAQPDPRTTHTSLKRQYDDYSRSANPASHAHSGSTRALSQSPLSSTPASASPTPSPSHWTPSPSPSIGTVDLARTSSTSRSHGKGKQPSSSSSSRRSGSRSGRGKESKSASSTGHGGTSSSSHRANPPGLPAAAFNTFSVAPAPATQFAPSGAMYMGAVDLQSDAASSVVEHGPTELPPRQYVGGSDAVSPWTPKKNLGTIPGSAMEYLPALEDRLSRLELNVGRYVEYRGEKAVENAIAPDLKKPE